MLRRQHIILSTHKETRLAIVEFGPSSPITAPAGARPWCPGDPCTSSPPRRRSPPPPPPPRRPRSAPSPPGCRFPTPPTTPPPRPPRGGELPRGRTDRRRRRRARARSPW
ncbi:hypothetical protein EE612_032536 [Oryza sativa]|nr:hypothetical protein EE612_032536 [Oryza sativa]